MKRSILAISILISLCSLASAADYIGVDFEHGDIWYDGTYHTITFRFTYECADPALLPGTSNGFTFTTTGDGMFDHVDDDFVKYDDPYWPSVFGGLTVNENAPGANPSSGTGLTFGDLLTGGVCGIPSGELVDYVFLEFNVTVHGGDGQFCIDSAWVSSTGPWKWSGMTCGLGGAPDRPLFIDGAGSDDNHPICVDVDTMVCDGPVITTTPPGDQITVNHCNGTSFQFAADPGTFGPDPASIAGWSVTSGPGTINASGNYTITPQPTGTYDVTIEVANDCDGTDTYNFQVVFTNNAPSFVGCPVEKNAAIDDVATVQLHATDSDACDDLTYSLLDDDGQSNVSVSSNGTFTWNPTASTIGTYTFVAGVEDGEGGTDQCVIEVTLYEGPYYICGDVDGSETIDISDMVYLLNYIFRGGPEPMVLESGNINCNGGIDIDDYVYLINYIFRGGPEPCDPDGNGIPDC